MTHPTSKIFDPDPWLKRATLQQKTGVFWHLYQAFFGQDPHPNYPKELYSI